MASFKAEVAELFSFDVNADGKVDDSEYYRFKVWLGFMFPVQPLVPYVFSLWHTESVCKKDWHSHKHSTQVACVPCPSRARHTRTHMDVLDRHCADMDGSDVANFVL